MRGVVMVLRTVVVTSLTLYPYEVESEDAFPAQPGNGEGGKLIRYFFPSVDR